MISTDELLVSVIIPNYNRTDQLFRAIQSVLDQNITSFEIIVVDDCSTLDPLPGIQLFKDSRIKMIRLKEKKNAAYARNVGINKSVGKFISFLDSDDAYLPYHLYKRINLLTENPNYDGVYGSAIKVNGNVKETFISSQIKPEDSMLEYLLSGSLKACMPSQFLKGGPVKDILFDETLLQHQDYDFSIRFHEKYKFLCDRDPSVLVYVDDFRRMGRNVDHDSCLRFIDKYRHTIKDNTYYDYLLRQLIHEYKDHGKTVFYINYKKRLLSGKHKIKNWLKIMLLNSPLITKLRKAGRRWRGKIISTRAN